MYRLYPRKSNPFTGLSHGRRRLGRNQNSQMAQQYSGGTALRVEPLEDRRLLDAGLPGELMDASVAPSVAWSTYVDVDDDPWRMRMGVSAVALNEEGSIFAAHSRFWDDATVAKISADGQQEIWKSVFNKENHNALYFGRSIDVDANDNAFFTGGIYDTAHVTKLDALGVQQWTWSPFKDGGHRWCEPFGLVVDPGGTFIYVTGRYSYSNQRADDVFLMKLSVDQPGSPELMWTKTFGGSDFDIALDIALDSSGNVVLAGVTTSADFPMNGFDTDFGGGYYGDAFVMKVNPDDPDGAIYSTYLGGSGDELWATYDVLCPDVAVDPDDNILVTGASNSADWIGVEHGWQQDGYDVGYNEGQDAFIVKLSSDLQTGLWATYLGGAQDDYGADIAVDQDGNIFVAGKTFSDGWAENGFDLNLSGENDAFVAQLSPSGEHVWSSYLGGEDTDEADGVAIDATGDLVVAGATTSPGWIAGGYEEEYQGERTGFVAKISLGPPPAPSLSIDDVEVIEGDGGSTIAAFTVTRSGDTSGGVSVDYATADGTARAGSDYTTASGTLYFASGEVCQTINVAVLGDVVEELDETFYVDLSNANGATIADPQAVATIIDDDAVSELIDVYIADIRFESKRGDHDWRAVVEVLTVDGDAPVEGVTLKVDFVGTTYTVVTDSDGVARTSWQKNLASGNYLADAYDVAWEDPDFFWTPFAFDHETDSDGDGKPDDLLEI